MSNKLPGGFRKSSEIIASFDYFDYVTGRGFRSIYLAQSRDSGGVSYFATTDSSIASDPNATTTTNNRFIDDTSGLKSFDITFNVPARVGGDAFINYTMQLTAASVDAHATFEIFLVNSAGTETSIGSVTGATTSSPGGGGVTLRLNAKITLTETSIAIGEKLRIKARTFRDAGGGTVRLFIDPAAIVSATESPAGGTVPYNTVIRMPFIIAQ